MYHISKHQLIILILISLCSCSKKSENPSDNCPRPTKDYYLRGEINSKCTLIQEYVDNYLNDYNGVLGGYNCVAFIGSSLYTMDNNPDYTFVISVLRTDSNCIELSSNSILPGKYTLINGPISEAGDAVVKVETAIDRMITNIGDQDKNAYFQIDKVEDLPTPAEPFNNKYFKKITGKTSCKLYGYTDTLVFKDVEFVMKVYYR